MTHYVIKTSLTIFFIVLIANLIGMTLDAAYGWDTEIVQQWIYLILLGGSVSLYFGNKES